MASAAARHADIHAARGGDGRVVGDDLAGELRHVDRRERPLAHAGLLACERQQLLDEVRRAREPGAHLGERGAPFGLGRRALGELRLQVHGGERRAQLVRRIGDERALRAERAIEPGREGR